MDQPPINFPLPGNRWARLDLPSLPLSQVEWERLLNILNAMHPGLISHE